MRERKTSGRARLPSLALPLRSWRGGGSGGDSPAAPGQGAPQAMDVDASSGDGAADTSMDWAPTPPPPTRTTRQQHITFARQRFVPPDTRKPTGLEGMFERVVAVRAGEDGAGEGEAKGPDPMQGVEMAKPGGAGWWKGWLGR